VLSLDYHSVGTSLQNVTDGWEAWNRFRFLCCHNPQVAVAIELTEDLPDTLEMMNRWTGEPVRAVIIPTYVFLTNKKDFPVLSSRHQDALRILMTHKVHIILKGRPTHCGGESMTPYVEYIQHIYARLQQARGSQNNLYASYRDYLQAPLQPLMDNLESQVYETFEQDPVKYRLYELAITKALLSIKEGKKSNIRNGFNSDECDIDDAAVNGEDEMMVNAESDLVYVMVVGAGRGPLVACTLSAAAATSTMVHIYAVEKNKNAVITLRNRCKQESWTNVDIVNCDMRHWSPPQKADLMVSELLGSWGDNELSPECLDGAQVGLKDSGISIPHSYTSFLAPISASKLWNSARSQPGGKVRVIV
jgi:protein arginine N-methyltransferase 5